MDRRKTLRPAVILLVAEVVMVISDVMLAVVPLVNACSKSNRLIAECRLAASSLVLIYTVYLPCWASIRYQYKTLFRISFASSLC